MIRIDRVAEPLALKRAAKRRLAEASLAFHQGQSVKSMLEGYGPPSVREALYKQQRGRCAYCERPVGMAANPIEHFRPKTYAQRAGHPKDYERYWWLTWDWNNLFLSCASCNSPGIKGNRFDLVAGTSPALAPVPNLASSSVITPATHPVSTERSLFIDPGAEYPHRHFSWYPVDDKVAPTNWSWNVVGRTTRGTYCIDHFNLTEAAEQVQGEWRALAERLISSGAFRGSVVTPHDWTTLCAEALRPEYSFRGARYGMLLWCLANVSSLHGLAPPSPPTTP
jgi:uncharacterized protein (TIGR02646 family)